MIQYTISFPQVNLHYLKVQMHIDVADKDELSLIMPVWSPGSYMVREFSRNVESFQANVPWKKSDKCTWTLDTKDQEVLIIDYDVYAFEISVRHSYVDANWAFLHGVSVFMYVDGAKDESIELNINSHANWKDVEVALPKIRQRKNSFSCENYDLLVDSPIALGNFDKGNYESGGVEHKVVMIGDGNYNMEKILADFKLISDVEVDLIGEQPSSPIYIHFILNVEKGRGGLEHLNSQTSMMQRWDYLTEDKYANFLGLIAHEYFHLWNIKRIRPIELGPFDYTKENYTEQLWVAEGITSYYDDKVLHRSGLINEEMYFKALCKDINFLENSPGKTKMSLAESSFNAWIRQYYQNENTRNVTVSYYNKGSVVSTLLDLEIIHRTSGKKGLDDLMSTLYQNFHKVLNRGFSADEFKRTLEGVAGSDFTEFLEEMIHSSNPISYDRYFGYVGLELKNKNEDTDQPWLGVEVVQDKDKSRITQVYSNGPAAKAGLSVNDRVLSLNGWQIAEFTVDVVQYFGVGEQMLVEVSRGGKIRNIPITLEPDPNVDFELVQATRKTKTMQKLQDIWLQKFTPEEA
jgi:predicted metalloprotease with PDZ domain